MQFQKSFDAPLRLQAEWSSLASEWLRQNSPGACHAVLQMMWHDVTLGHEASSNKCHAIRNKCLTSSNNKKLLAWHLLLLAWHLMWLHDVTLGHGIEGRTACNWLAYRCQSPCDTWNRLGSYGFFRSHHILIIGKCGNGWHGSTLRNCQGWGMTLITHWYAHLRINHKSEFFCIKWMSVIMNNIRWCNILVL